MVFYLCICKAIWFWVLVRATFSGLGLFSILSMLFDLKFCYCFGQRVHKLAQWVSTGRVVL